MPIYMDIHRGTEASVDEVHAAHLSDLEAQEKYGVKYLKYWFNPSSTTVCCLVEGPNPEACEAVHREAHGLTPDKIIEVEEDVVQAFLGDSVDAGFGRMVRPTGTPDGGFRTVLFTDIVDSTALTQKLGDAGVVKLLEIHDRIIRRYLDTHGGREVKHTGDGIMASFPSAEKAIRCAIAIQREFARHNEERPDRSISVRIGLSAGEPVESNQDLFGATVQLARRVCDEANAGKIYVSNVVRELCLGKNFQFAGLGARDLKGFPDPVIVHEVGWA